MQVMKKMFRSDLDWRFSGTELASFFVSLPVIGTMGTSGLNGTSDERRFLTSGTVQVAETMLVAEVRGQVINSFFSKFQVTELDGRRPVQLRSSLLLPASQTEAMERTRRPDSSTANNNPKLSAPLGKTNSVEEDRFDTVV